MRTLPPNLPEGEVQRKQIGGEKTVRQRVEVTLERETVTIFRSGKTAMTADGYEVCACCGQHLKVGQPHSRPDAGEGNVQIESPISLTDTNSEVKQKE